MMRDLGYYGLILYGQSLALGAGSTAQTSTQPFFNKTFLNAGPNEYNGVRGGGNVSKPLIETGGTWPCESPCSPAANRAVDDAQRLHSIAPEDFKIFCSTAAYNGATIAFLSEGYPDGPFPWIAAQAEGAAACAVADGVSGTDGAYQVCAMAWIQGEADAFSGTTRADYLAALTQLRIDANTAVAGVVSGNPDFPFLTYQTSTRIALHGGAVALAQYDAAISNDNFLHVTPTYPFWSKYLPSNVHMEADGYDWMAAYFGRAYQQLVVEGRAPDRLWPISAKYVARQLTVTFDVPTPPLVLDTTLIGLATNYGFYAYDDDGELEISDVAVVSATDVRMTLSRMPRAGAVLTYAVKYLGAGVTVLDGASGNLRDSTPDTVVINSTTYPMFHWGPHFDMAMTLDNTGLPPGGTTGQILAKLSDLDFDAGWKDMSRKGSGPVTVSFHTPGDQAVTFTRNHMEWRRFDDVVFFTIVCFGTITWTTAAGNFEIHGLPFNLAVIADYFPITDTLMTQVPTPAGSTATVAVLAGGADWMNFQSGNVSGGVNFVGASNMVSPQNFRFNVQGFYITNDP